VRDEALLVERIRAARVGVLEGRGLQEGHLREVDGLHQPGILTPPGEAAAIVALDAIAPGRAELIAARAERPRARPRPRRGDARAGARRPAR
jgi:hypothetical protein